MNRARKILLQVLPWLIAAGMTALVLQKYSLDEIIGHMRRGNALGILPYGLITPLFYMGLVALSDLVILRGLDSGFRYGEIFRGKSGTATLVVLSYAFGGGAYALWLGRRTGAGVKATMSALLFVLWSDLTAVAAIPAIVVLSGHGEVPRPLAIAVVAIALFQPLAVLLKLPQRVFPVLKLSRAAALGQLAVRLLAVTLSAVATWLGALAFGLELPLGHAAIHIPIVLVVQSLPVHVGAFGAVQGVWILAFGELAPVEQILAYQILWQLLLGLAMVLRGIFFVRRIISEIDQGKE